MSITSIIAELRKNQIDLIAEMLNCVEDPSGIFNVIKNFTHIDLQNIHELSHEQIELLTLLEVEQKGDLLRAFCPSHTVPDIHEEDTPAPSENTSNSGETDVEAEVKKEEIRASVENFHKAREMYVESLKTDKMHSSFIMIYGIVVGLMSFLYIYLVTFLAIPPENVRYADICLGIVAGNCIGSVLNFFFGSGVSSPIVPARKR